MTAARNIAIATAFRSGTSRNTLAARYDLTPRRISQIAAAHGVHRYYADQVALGLLSLGGRPRLALPAADARHYVKLRRIMGAAYARQAMGV